MYRKNISRKFIKGICKRNIYTTWGTNKDRVKLRPKVYSSILGSLYSKTKNPNGNFNSILPTDKQTNKETKLNIKTVFTALYQLYTEQLGIIITSYTVCI